jgi:NADH-quinone oxidoreductase subunit D
MSELLLSPEDQIRKANCRTNEDGSELSILNLGPTHPQTHGIFSKYLLMDGERIIEATTIDTFIVHLKNCRKPTFYQLRH